MCLVQSVFLSTTELVVYHQVFGRVQAVGDLPLLHRVVLPLVVIHVALVWGLLPSIDVALVGGLLPSIVARDRKLPLRYPILPEIMPSKEGNPSPSKFER